MKTLIIGIFLIGTVVFFTNSPKAEITKTEKAGIVSFENELPLVDEAVHCVIKDSSGNKVAECWFCDCAELLKTYLDSKKEDAEEEDAQP